MKALVLALVFVMLAVGASAATLEIPGPDRIQSGVHVISGWKCDAGEITVRFDDGPPIPLVYGSQRTDTRGVCGDDDNGFVAIWNWSKLSDGEHVAVVYDDGVEFDRAYFTVVSHGVEWLRDVDGTGSIALSNGQIATVEWVEGKQGFVATHFTEVPPPPEPEAGGTCIAHNAGGVCTTKTVREVQGDAHLDWTVERFPTHLVLSITLLTDTYWEDISLYENGLFLYLPGVEGSAAYYSGLQFGHVDPEKTGVPLHASHLEQGVPHQISIEFIPSEAEQAGCAANSTPCQVDWMQPFTLVHHDNNVRFEFQGGTP